MRKALGRGLDALIPGAGAAPSSTLASAPSPDRSVDLTNLTPNPRQPRVTFDEAALEELAASIREQGVLQPILVRPLGGGRFEIVAGERRFRAAQRAGLTKVPVVVRDLSDAETLEIALIENVQRDDLSPLEEATAYQRLIDEFGHTQEEVATRVGKSRPAIANALRLLRLPDAVKEELARGRLTAGHARVLVGIDGGADAQVRAMRQILARQLSVREAEQIGATSRKTPLKEARRGASADPNHRAFERALSTALGTRVRIRPRGKGGTIEVEYYTNEQLQGLGERLGLRPGAF
jgi:ParB family chromosome partitioning protein